MWEVMGMVKVRRLATAGRLVRRTTVLWRSTTLSVVALVSSFAVSVINASEAGAVTSKWSETSIQPYLPLSDNSIELTSVSCPTDGNCTAVGYQFVAGGYGLIFNEVNGAWQYPITAPHPSTTYSNAQATLTAVS